MTAAEELQLRTGAAAHALAGHINARLVASGAKLLAGTFAADLATKVVGRWDAPTLRVFSHLTGATAYLTKAQIAEALSISTTAVDNAWRTIRKAKIVVYAPGSGEPETMRLFRDDHEATWAGSGSVRLALYGSRGTRGHRTYAEAVPS